VNVEQTIEADWTWTGQSFEKGVQVVVKADGRIDLVGRLGLTPTKRLADRALLPGMVSAHSHAFQRGLRGQAEVFPDGAGSFWTWREAMYRLVAGMDGDVLFRLCRQTFGEMLAAGISAVGEFHYLHHDASFDGYAYDDIVLQAAANAGIRLVLLNTYYRTGGIGQPLNGPQKRFATPSTDVYWRQMDRLARRADPWTQSLGVAAHSIRAVGMEEIAALHAEARRRGMVFHIHVEEQRREVEECVSAYGTRPLALLNERLDVDERFTAVHCTHSESGDLGRFARHGGNVCLCPLTEANLGDGLADLPAIRAGGGHICVGTDSNARICMTEELRWLEYGQRLRSESRGVCRDAAGSVARGLWETVTVGGARSLGLKTGRIEVGFCADFVAIDLKAPALAGWTPETLLEAFIFGSAETAVAGTCVGGRWAYSKPGGDESK